MPAVIALHFQDAPVLVVDSFGDRVSNVFVFRRGHKKITVQERRDPIYISTFK